MSTSIDDRYVRSFAAAKRSTWSKSNVAGAVGVLLKVRDFLAERGVPSLLEADSVDLQEYLNARLDSGTSPNTVIVDHRQLKAFYGWAALDPGDGRPYLDRNPMLRVHAPKGADPDPARTPTVTEEQYRALLATCHRKAKKPGRGGKVVNDRRDAAIIAVLWHTGARRGELPDVEYRHIDWDTQMLHLPRTKGRGKSRSRDVYLDDEAMDRLTLYVHERGDHDGPLFESTHRVAGTHRRAGIKPNTITLMLRRRCTLAGLNSDIVEFDFGAHAFRRAVARDWLDNGGAVTMLETNMGWKHDGRMAAVYTRKAEAKLAAAEAARVAQARRGGRHLRAVGE